MALTDKQTRVGGRPIARTSIVRCIIKCNPRTDIWGHPSLWCRSQWTMRLFGNSRLIGVMAWRCRPWFAGTLGELIDSGWWCWVEEIHRK